MKIVAILQARMGSTRLPGKVMLPLAGKPMIQNIIERVQRATRVHEVMVTCPIQDRDAFLPVMQACRNGKTFLDEWFEDENDLVGRYLQSAIRRDADIIVRVPCDNPCVDPGVIDQSVDAYLDAVKPLAFFSSTVWPVNYVNVDGLGCDVLSLSRLKWLDRKTKGNAHRREHPHAYFYDTGCIYHDPTGLRLDVNTQEDYGFIASIYNHFGHNRFTAPEILACPPVQERLHGR